MSTPYCPAVCKSCGARDSIIVDDQAAEVVCTECGVVHQMGLVESMQTAWVDDVVAPARNIATAAGAGQDGNSKKASAVFERTLSGIADRTGASEAVTSDARALAVSYLERTSESGRGTPRGDCLAIACLHLASLRHRAPIDVDDAARIDPKLATQARDMVKHVRTVLQLDVPARDKVLEDAVRMLVRAAAAEEIQWAAEERARATAGSAGALGQAAAVVDAATEKPGRSRIITDESVVATVASAFAAAFDEAVTSGETVNVIAAVSTLVALTTPLSRDKVVPACGAEVARRIRFAATKDERQRLEQLLGRAGRCATGLKAALQKLTPDAAKRWADAASKWAAVRAPQPPSAEAGTRRERE